MFLKNYYSAMTVLKGTDMPTDLRYAGFDPFTDNGERRYLNDATFRVLGLLRVEKQKVVLCET
jgi:hypothetical protein